MIVRIALSVAFLSIASNAAPILVPNFSFETATLSQNAGNGPLNQLIAGSTIFAQGGTLGSWTASSTTTGAAAGAYSPNPGGFNWTSTWWNGSNIGYVQIDAPGSVSLNDSLAATLTNNTTYTLTVDIGSRTFAANFGYAIQLFAGSNLLGSASHLALPHNSSGTDSLTYVSGGSNPFAGQMLSIGLAATDTGSTFTEAFFDNVRLDASPATGVPEPGTITLIALGAVLAVGKSGRLERNS